MTIYNEGIRIAEFILKAMVHVSVFLFLSSFISSVIKTYGATKYIENYIRKHKNSSIILGSVLGCLVPICSCGVIPIIAAFLASGIPLGPIMAFWLTAPIMDCATFILTWGVINPQMAIARLVSAMLVGCSSGFIIAKLGLKATLKIKSLNSCCSSSPQIKTENACCSSSVPLSQAYMAQTCCSSQATAVAAYPTYLGEAFKKIGELIQTWKIDLLLRMMLRQTIFIGKWLAVAYLLEALMIFYLPGDYLKGIYGNSTLIEVPLAALIGIPMYLNNVSGVPFVDGLTKIGMSQGAALTFLIAGPITTIPAMVAVFKIVSNRIFAFYVLFGFLSAILCGYIYELIIKLG